MVDLMEKTPSKFLKLKKQVQRKCKQAKQQFFCALHVLPKLFARRHFLVPFLLSFFIFGFLLNFFASGTANWQLFQLSNLRGKLILIFDTFLAVIGVGRTWPDFLYLTALNLVQSVLIGLLFFILNFRKQAISNQLERTGIIASFFLLSSGCPTCGTALLTPVLISILGSSGLALVGAISAFLTGISLILAFSVFQKIGYEAYIIIEDEKYRAKSQNTQESSKEAK